MFQPSWVGNANECTIFRLDIPSSDIFSPDSSHPEKFPSTPGTFPSAVKARICKLALTRCRDPNPPMTCLCQLAHLNGRSLYIVDWRTVVVEGGNVYTSRKIKGKVREGNVWPGECPDPIRQRVPSWRLSRFDNFIVADRQQTTVGSNSKGPVDFLGGVALFPGDTTAPCSGTACVLNL